MSAGTEVSLTPTRQIARLVRFGTRRLTRAHLALHHRSGLRDVAVGLLPELARVVGEQIGAELVIEARLLDGAFTPRATLPRTSGYAVLDLGAAQAVAVLEIELPFLVAILGRIAGAPTRTGPATAFTRIEEAAFGLVVLTALTAARRDDRIERVFAPRLSSLTTERTEVFSRIDERQTHVAIDLRFKVDGQVGAGRLLIPARTVQVLTESFPSSPAPAPALPGGVAAASILAKALCGTSRLSAEELATLQAGDVVLLEELRVAAGQLHGPARLATALFDVFGELSPAGFVTQRANPRTFPQEPPMSQSPSPEAAAFPPLPLEVEVELTRLRLTVSEVANLRAGALLPLHINSSEPVVLRVGDRAVARAELVEIEGEVGARILALLP